MNVKERLESSITPPGSECGRRTVPGTACRSTHFATSSADKAKTYVCSHSRNCCLLSQDSGEVSHDNGEVCCTRNPMKQFIHWKMYEIKISWSAYAVSSNSFCRQTFSALLEPCIVCQDNSMAGCTEQPCTHTARPLCQTDSGQAI